MASQQDELPWYLSSRTECPECSMYYDEAVHRRLTETYCGHQKCRACSLMQLFCRQCRAPEPAVLDSAFDPRDAHPQYMGYSQWNDSKPDSGFYPGTLDTSAPWTPRFPPKLAAATSVETQYEPPPVNTPPPPRHFVTEPIPATVTSSGTSWTPRQRPESVARACDPLNGAEVPQGATSQLQETISPIKRKRRPLAIPDHIIVLKGERPVYRCKICGKEFKTKANIKYHLWCANKDQQKPFLCKECGKDFVTKSHFQYHMRTHTGELPFECPQCGKRFNQRGKVTRHLRIHTGEKPYNCAVCGDKYVTRQALESHTLVHTRERPHACDSCDKRFSSMSNLKKHTLTHTGEKRYQCHECGKLFALRWTFESHVQNRHQERPFECSQCEKAFTSKKYLNRHSTIHTSDNLVACPICGRKLKRKANMIRHLEKGHGQPQNVARALAVIAVNGMPNQTPVKVVAAPPSKSATERIESSTILEQSAGSSVVRSESATIQPMDTACTAENEGPQLERIVSSIEVRPQNLFGSAQVTVVERTDGGHGIRNSDHSDHLLMMPQVSEFQLKASQQNEVQYLRREQQWKQIQQRYPSELQFYGCQRQCATRKYTGKRFGRRPVRLGSRISVG